MTNDKWHPNDVDKAHVLLNHDGTVKSLQSLHHLSYLSHSSLAGRWIVVFGHEKFTRFSGAKPIRKRHLINDEKTRKLTRKKWFKDARFAIRFRIVNAGRRKVTTCHTSRNGRGYRYQNTLNKKQVHESSMLNREHNVNVKNTALFGIGIKR